MPNTTHGFSRVTATITALAGVCTILTAVSGALTYHAAQDQKIIKQTQQTIINNSSTSTAEIESLQARVTALEKAPKIATDPASSGTPSPATSSTAIKTPPVRRTGTLEVTNATGYADLDAQASDPSWGRNGDTKGDGMAEGPGSNGSHIYIVNQASGYFVGDHPANYGTCSTEQSYTNIGPAIGDLDKGANICLKTSAGRYALLTVSQEATSSLVKFHVTVWQKP